MKISRPLVVLDLETTGTWIEKDKIVEIGMVKYLPDGSKESWNTSDRGDEARKLFKMWMNDKYRENHYLSFVECFYDDDDGKCEIVDHSKSVASKKIRQETE